MRKMILLAGACALLAACGQNAQQPVSVDSDDDYATYSGATTAVAEDEEDCDAEDFANREEDCGFSKKHKTHKGYKAPKHKTVKPSKSYGYSSSSSSSSSKPSYGYSSSSSKPSYSSSSRSSSRSSSSGRRR